MSDESEQKSGGLFDLLDAASKIRDAFPEAMAELADKAAPTIAALGGTKKESAPRFWIRLAANGDPLSCTREKLSDEPKEGERDVCYRPA